MPDFYRINEDSLAFKDNQGFINAKVVRLFKLDKTTLKVYTDTLSESQKKQARNHLRTVLRLQDDQR